MRLLLTFLSCFYFVFSGHCQDPVYFNINRVQRRPDSTVLTEKLNHYEIIGFHPNGVKAIEGELKDDTYKYPETRSGQGSTAYSYTTGRILEAEIKVPLNDLKTFHTNGSLNQHYDGNSNTLKTLDSNGRLMEMRYFNRNLELDTLLTFWDDGSVLCREYGNTSEYKWSLNVKPEYNNRLLVNRSIPKSKTFYYPTGEIESKWNLIPGAVNRLVRYDKKFYDKNGKVRKDLIQTNDFKLTGLVTTYYSNGNPKNQQQLYRDELHGTYRIWHENGQLIELGSKQVRKVDSTITRWHSNGQMKSWASDTAFFEWHFNGCLSRENCGKWGLNLEYWHDGSVYRDNYFRINGDSKNAINIRHQGERDSLGFRHGVWKGYYVDSCLAYEAKFDHGYQIGIFKHYSDEGVLLKQIEFVEGVANGPATFYFQQTGAVVSEGEMKNGDKSGIWLTYDHDGQLSKKSIYNNGYEAVVLVQYHSDSIIAIKSEIDSLNHTIITSTFNSDGVISSRKTKNLQGNPYIEERFHANGNLKTYEGHFSDAKGQSIEYIRKEDVFDEMGNIVGTKDVHSTRVPTISRRYQYNGKLESESINGFKGEDNSIKVYHSNGELKEFTVYKSHSIHTDRCTKKYFDSNGKLVKTEILVDGKIVRTHPKPKSIFD